MPFDHQRSLVFLHIPKTDNTSIVRALGLHGTQLFTVVRNLWGRLLSSFHNLDPDLANYHRCGTQ